MYHCPGTRYYGATKNGAYMRQDDAQTAGHGPILVADTYRVTVSRIDSNLYRDSQSKTIIETRYCYEYATLDDAVLKWEGKYGNNWIVFSSGTKCDVVALR